MKITRVQAQLLMDHLAAQTWHTLRQCFDLDIRFDEDAITTQLLIALATQLNGRVVFADGRKTESKTGCDFELWVAQSGGGWRRYAIQAKRITIPNAVYKSMKHEVGKHSGIWQHELLRAYAGANRAEPLYLLYNHWDPHLVPARNLKHASTASSDTRFGCAITSLHTAVVAIGGSSMRNYPWMQQQTATRPWSSLLDPARSSAGATLPSDLAAAESRTDRGAGTDNDREPWRQGERTPGGNEVSAVTGSNYHDALPAQFLLGSRYPDQDLTVGVALNPNAELGPRAILILGEFAEDS